MRRATFLPRLLLLASACALVQSCGDRPRPVVNLRPPADLFVRANEPPMTPAALESEEVYERERDAKIEWGRGVASQFDAVCRWMLAAGVEGIRCRKAGRSDDRTPTFR